MESKEQHLTRQYLFLCILIILLAGCANKSNFKTGTYNNWKEKLAAQQTWQVKGKLAFISPKERQSANLTWQQSAIKNHLVLTTFIGTRILSLQQTINGAELTYNGQTYTDSNASALLYRLTGFTLPVNNADNWLKGTIADTTFNTDPFGRAQTVLWFDNNGKQWVIEYTDFIQQSGYWLPQKLNLSHQQIKIKIHLYDWQLN